LDKPNKKEKQKRYEQQYKKLDKIKFENLPEENRKKLKELK